jgi:hypothetical protein
VKLSSHLVVTNDFLADLGLNFKPVVCQFLRISLGLLVKWPLAELKQDSRASTRDANLN